MPLAAPISRRESLDADLRRVLERDERLAQTRQQNLARPKPSGGQR